MHIFSKRLNASVGERATHNYNPGPHLDCCNQRSCIAEAYKTRGRSFQGRQLGHLVASKAGCNQAGGSFLSAASWSRYAAGCRVVGGLSFALHRTDDGNTILAIFTVASY